MSIDFFQGSCQTYSQKQKFGLCDDKVVPGERGKPAYIDEANGENWIATIDNYYRKAVTFTGIDHCVDFPKVDDKESERCDGVLRYEQVIAFIELKGRDEHGSKWVKKAEAQLRVTIGEFEKSDYAEDYRDKKAFIANSERPQFRQSQTTRMERFFDETGYVLRIEARIVI